MINNYLIRHFKMIKKDKIPIFAQTVVCWVALGVFEVLFRFKVEGQENLKGLEDGPIIFVSNHNSYIDGGIAGASLLKGSSRSNKFFPVRYLVASEYFRWKYFPVNIFVMLGGSVKVKRAKIKKVDNSHLFDSLINAIKALGNGNKVWIYPEGGFNNDGTPKKPRNGVTFLHQQTKTPIVPVKMIGNNKVMSKYAPFVPSIKTLLGLNKVKVVFGKPIFSLDAPDIDQGTKILMDKIEELV